MTRRARKNTSDSRMKVWYKLMYGTACVVCSVAIFCTQFSRAQAETSINTEQPTTVHEEGMMLPMSAKRNSDLVLQSDVRIAKGASPYSPEPAEDIEEKVPQMETFVVKTEDGCRITDVYDDTDESNIIGYLKTDDIVSGIVNDNYLKMDCEENAYVKMSQLVPYVSEYISVNTLDVHSSEFTYWTCVQSSSGLSRDDIKLLLKDTRLEESADTFYECEKIYGVNVYFALAVAKLESAWGTSDAGLYSNNLFGIMNISGIVPFSSLDSCIEYWFELMHDYYFKRDMTSPSDIGNVYCDSSWSPYIVGLMNEICDKMDSLKSTT